jgi:hypothetical protein
LRYDLAARALGHGRILAQLFELGASADSERLHVAVPTAELTGPRLKRLAEALVALADELEQLSLPDALARFVLDLATRSERLTAFGRLVAAYPEADVTRRCAGLLAEADDSEEPALRDAARAFLERAEAPRAAAEAQGG